jgi:hypothetical protein
MSKNMKDLIPLATILPSKAIASNIVQPNLSSNVQYNNTLDNSKTSIDFVSEEDAIESELEKGLLKKYQKRDGLFKRKLKSSFLNKDILEKSHNSYLSDEDFHTKNNSKKDCLKKISFKRFNKLSSIIKLSSFNNLLSINQTSSFNKLSPFNKTSSLINPPFLSQPSPIKPTSSYNPSLVHKATKIGAYLSLSTLISIYALDASANVGFKINDATTAAFNPIIDGIKANWGKAVTMAGIGGVFLSEGDGRTRAIKAGIGAGCMGGFILLMLSLFG